MNIKEKRSAAEINLKSLIDSLPASLEKREDEFFNKIVGSRYSNLKKLEKLYAFMSVLYNHVHKFTPCKKGCAYCCSYDVTISDIEIQFIEKSNKKIKRKKNISTSSKGTYTPCPFLKNNICSIYDSRPYVCRRHVMLTPDNLVCTKEHSNRYELQLLAFSELDKSYDHIRAESGSNEFYDIRDVFRNKKNKIKG